MSGSYDFEEQERIAELKAWWEDNRWYVVGAMVAAVLAFVGYRGWKEWSARQAEDAAAMYQPVADASKAADPKKLASAVDAIVSKHPRSFYASQAALIAARAAFDANNMDEAKKRLEWVVEHGPDEHRGVARVRLAAVLLDQKKYTEALQVLDANKDEGFAALAADLRGDIMLAQGRLDEARAAYKLAIEKAGASHPVKSLAQTKLNSLGGAQ